MEGHGALVALQQHNISVPDKVKIVGYDGTYVSKYCNPPITTIYQDKKELAFKSSELLLNLINEETVDSKKDIIVPIKLIKQENYLKKMKVNLLLYNLLSTFLLLYFIYLTLYILSIFLL